MFLKHQDVKQKNWRMRKVKKLFVSSCMLLTVGLGVAVPTAFSQSNGVMVVKAAEVPESVLGFVDSLAPHDNTRIGRYFATETEPKDYNFYYIHSGQYAKDPKQKFVHYPNRKYSYDSTIQANQGRLTVEMFAKSGQYQTPDKFSVVLQVPTKTLKKDHKYQFRFSEESDNDAILTKYLVAEMPKEPGSSYSTNQEEKVARKVKLHSDNSETELPRNLQKNVNGTKILEFVSNTENKASLSLVVSTNAALSKKSTTTFKNFQFIDITPPAIIDDSNSKATAGSNTVSIKLKGQDGRTNFAGETVEVYRKGQLIGTTTVGKSGNSNVEIKLKQGVSPLKKDEILTFQVVQPNSKKRDVKAGNLKVILSPEVEALQKSKKEELETLRKQIENDIKMDGWLSEKDSKPQNTGKESQTTKLNSQYEKAIEEIGNASTKTEIEEILKKYKDKTSADSLPNQHVKGNKAQEQQKAKEDLTKLHKEIEKKITDDPWLTEEARKQQLAAEKKAFDNGTTAIEKANSLVELQKTVEEYKSKDKNQQKSIPNQHIPADEQAIKAAKKTSLKELRDTIVSAIQKDLWLTPEEKIKQIQQADEALKKGEVFVENSQNLKELEDGLKNYIIKDNRDESIPNKYQAGKKDELTNKAEVKLKEAHEATKQAIEKDPWLSPEQKKAQKENAKARLDAGLKAVETTESLDKLKEVESDFLDKEKAKSIPSQHQAGTPEVARKTFLDNFEKEAQKELESIKNDVTLTDAEKATAKAKVEAQLQEAKDKAKESKSFDDLKNIQDKFNSELPHTTGKPLKDQQSDAIAELEKKQQEIEKAISEDKTLSKDEKEKQIADSKAKLVAEKEKVSKAPDADAVKKALESGKQEIAKAYVPQNLEDHKKKLLAELKQKANDTEKAIDFDKTLTAKEKEEQKAKTKEELQKATEAVGAIDNREELDKKVPELKKAIQDSHVKGDLEGVKNKAIEDLQKVHDETVAKINGDDTLDKATKEAQVKEADKALAAGKDAITKADDADKVGAAVTEHTPKIKAAHKTGDLKKVQEEANQALDKAAEKEREEINNDATLTTEDKAKQLKEVETALTKAKDNVKAAKTADAINDARDKGVATIDAVHKAGQDLGARKSGQVAKLEEAAKATKDKISADPTLTSKEKEEQSKAVNAELKKAIEAVNAADTADKVDDALGKGVIDIKNQHKTGDPVVARREAHGKQLDRVAQETKDAIEKDPTLTTEEKAKQVKDVDAAKERGMAKLNEAKDADALDKAYGEGVTDIKNQHKSGDPIEARRGLHNKSIDEVAQATKDAITADTTLTEAEKETQRGNVDKEATKAKEELAKAKDADALDKAYGDGVTSIKNQHKSGDPIEARRGLHNKSIDEVAQATKDAITADTTLTEAEKETQRGNVDKEATKAKEELAKAKDADALDKAYGDGVTSIKNQHKSGKGLDVRKDEHKKALEAVAKRVTAEIEADPTLTPEVREQQKAEVQKELELATDKIAEAKDADEADKAYGDGVTAIENAHVIGKGIEARKDLAKKDLAEAVAKTKALIIEDKTLTDDQRKEQLSGVDTEYAKGIENIAAAKDAAGVDKAYSDGVRDILAQYKEGQNLDDRRNAAKEFLLKEADKVTKLINDDPTLTHDQKVDQINKVEQAKLDAIKSVDDAQTADDINDALGKGIENINNQYQHGDGVDVRKATAKGDLEKEAAKVKALIAKDPTLTQADKDKQTAAVDAAKNTAIAAVDKATTADGVNQELGKGITAINKAYRPGEGVKARKEAAKADLEREAAKVREAIANDPTLTKADKAKQTEAVAKALKAAIAAVDKATTAEGINQELGKGITAINKAYRPGEAVKARKEAAKANLEKEAKETKALISGDRYLSETEKAAQKQAVEQALAKALGQVEAAKTVEAVKLAENLGTVAIRSAYVAGLAKDTDQATAALNEAKQAAIEALKQAAAETLAKITTDAKLTEAQKAEQSENVSLALKTAIATVRSAQSIASVKEAKDKGITAIRAAYVPNKAVAKSSSANHLPKSGDANSIVLVGLGVMSLLLGMVLYSKKKESKD
ncbi:LPXTG-motif cell wall anchor domain-containing protein [Streptococcus pyogenes]|uniref:DUF1542 domain-containing protein n=2 Tax=Streptococcus pyogenes TaxID=1314 RepID=UPI0010E531BE|nr:DUF1542 domain-containing protein [Streptococcus pyogenes]VHF45959.1 LPXTG-motif cell wall anchor domain-containing protein [Streptococcus pyogenes]HER5577026.1 DUF1542 domain-containing protein [Streptococcus pyogenes]HER6231126.1 DUF1542 domain-containing protein [Streptococcus pyogenes]